VNSLQGGRLGLWEKLSEISEAASFYLERTKVIQGNIANADTPGYVPKDLKFERVLREQLHLKRDDPRHIDPSRREKTLKIFEIKSPSGYDRNRVNLDRELAKLSESSIMYKALVESLKKEISKIKLSIQGR